MSEAHRNTRFGKWDLCNQNELVMDLAKTKAQVAQVREKPTRLQFYWWATRFAQRYHTYDFFIELGRPTRDMALRLFLFICSPLILLYALLASFSLFLFLPLTLLANKDYIN